jgi:rhamnose transport system ATP-binding protein
VSAPLLEFRGITKHFFGVHALEDVSFAVPAGEVHALCGANGAGKSTLMKILVGVHQPDGGEVLLEGVPVHLAGPAAAREHGIDIVFQEIELPPNLTVAEAVFLGREPRRWGCVDYDRMFAEAEALFRRLEVPILPGASVESLSVAEKQLVQIARALVGNPRVLIMDEPTSALTDHEVERLFRLLEGLRTAGTTILYVSHKLDEIFRLTQRVTTLRDGRLVDSVPTNDLTADTLIARMAGITAFATPTERDASSATVGEEVALEVEALSREGKFSNISFGLRRGEVLGMFGIVGAGRTEVARCLFGLDRPNSGTVRLAGKPAHFRSAAEAVAAGVALVPEDRKGQGLLLETSLQRNVSLPSLERLSTLGIINVDAERALAADAIRSLRVATDGPEQEVKQLSGGNQQKVVLAKWQSTHPQVLILDEPTKGIDVAAKREVHTLVRRLANEGLAVLLISSELDEVLSLSDRLLVLREGLVAGELPSQEATREAVMRLAVA